MEKCAAAGTGVLATRTGLFGDPVPSERRRPEARRFGRKCRLGRRQGDFPRAEVNPWLANAETHPLNAPTLKAVETYLRNRTMGGRRASGTNAGRLEKDVRGLIGAKPGNRLHMSTTDGEYSVVAGIDLARGGGNVVIDDLTSSLQVHVRPMAQKGPDRAARRPPPDWVIRTRTWPGHR